MDRFDSPGGASRSGRGDAAVPGQAQTAAPGTRQSHQRQSKNVSFQAQRQKKRTPLELGSIDVFYHSVFLFKKNWSLFCP